jgi:hypothetical protein
MAMGAVQVETQKLTMDRAVTDAPQATSGSAVGWQRFWSGLSAASLAIWLLLPAIENRLSYTAGLATLSPLWVKLLLHRSTILVLFIHVGLVSWHLSGPPFILRKPLRAALAASVACFLALLAAQLTLNDTCRMDSYCRGAAQAILGRVKQGIVVRELKSQLESPFDQLGGVPTPPEQLLAVLRGENPRLLLLPLGAEAPNAIQVLWHRTGGTFGLHYGNPPKSPERFLDHQLQVTNGLWIVVRQP